MLRPTFFLLVGLGAGIVTAALWPGGPEEAAPPASPPGGVVERIAALERALNRETLRRAELEGALAALRARLEQADAAAVTDAGAPVASGAELAVERVEPAPAGAQTGSAPEGLGRRFGRERGNDLAARLVAGGFGADRAEWIQSRAAELRMETLQAQYEASRDGAAFAPRAAGTDPLRAELGDAEYERYREALGRPTSARVDGVIARSPAEQAGLAPGDRLVSYGGERVFDMRDLNRLVLEGAPGEPVTVDVLRDGQPIQLVLPRGPLGIWGPGGGRRGP